jgi:hypothetical protein
MKERSPDGTTPSEPAGRCAHSSRSSSRPLSTRTAASATHEPVQAAADGLRGFPADEILVVSPPGGDLAATLRQRTALPVAQLPA